MSLANSNLSPRVREVLEAALRGVRKDIREELEILPPYLGDERPPYSESDSGYSSCASSIFD